jgi:hypothetical protein
MVDADLLCATSFVMLTVGIIKMARNDFSGFSIPLNEGRTACLKQFVCTTTTNHI